MQKSRLRYEFMIISIALALLLVSVLAALLPPSDDFEPSNPYWNGLEEFFKATNAKVLSATEVVVPHYSIIFIIGPSLNSSQNQVEVLRNFVINGGTLVIMDETGAANFLLSALGLGIYIDGHTALDPFFYYRSWIMPKIIDFEEHSITKGVKSVILNKPSILHVKDPRVKILAKTSSFSFLDLNGDGRPQSDEPLGPFEVLVEVKYGEGRVIVFSDSSLFINGVLKHEDNIKLLMNLVENKTVYVDTSVWKTTMYSNYRNSISMIYETLSSSDLKYCVAVVAVMAIHALINKGGVVRRADEIEDLLRRHPDWDVRLLVALKEERSKLEPRGH